MNAKPWMCGLSFLGLLACVEQPLGYCQVAQQSQQAHFAVYEPIVPMGAGCKAAELITERISFETYQLPGKDEISIAWRTDTLQKLFDEAREAEDWSYPEAQKESLTLNVHVDYSSKPDKENRCYILDKSNPAAPQSIRRHSKTFGDTTYHYDWKNMVVYSMPASPGQLVEGEVTFSVEKKGAPACQGSYRFVALWPAYACDADEDCAPSVGGKEGSPLNPDFADALACHPAGYCTVTRPPAELIQKLSR